MNLKLLNKNIQKSFFMKLEAGIEKMIFYKEAI